ncbi:MAG: metallophosphoesterase family protein [Kiritimatiellia bacterium]
MRYAILGDIHANWEALSSVLEDATRQGVTAWVCVGDIVGYNADPCRCVDKIIELGCTCVQGNHDYLCVQPIGHRDLSPLAAAALRWSRAQLLRPQIEFLASLPRVWVKDFTLVHNSLDDTQNWNYVFNAQDAQASFRHQTTQVGFHGHTHIPAIFVESNGRVSLRHGPRLRLRPNARYFINVGSVGQPRDRNWQAAYVIYDEDAKTIELRRVDYNIQETQRKILEAGLPDLLALRLLLGI